MAFKELEKKTQVISHIIEWLDCFQNFALLFTQFFPEKLSQLWAYQIHIRRLTVGWPWNLIYEYDKQCRTLFHKDKAKHWDKPDDAFLSQMDHSIKAADAKLNRHKASRRGALFRNPNPYFRSTPSKRPSIRSPKPKPLMQGPSAQPVSAVCRNWQQDQCTFGNTCRYRHVYETCGMKNHCGRECRSPQTTPR